MKMNEIFLHQPFDKDYKAAAILCVALNAHNEIMCLVGMEYRHGRRVVGIPGGKRDATDKNESWTAWRETWEETGKSLRIHEGAKFLYYASKDLLPRIWLENCKQVVYIYPVNLEWGNNVAYQSRNSRTYVHDALEDIQWVPYKSLCIYDLSPTLYEVYKDIQVYDVLSTTVFIVD
jgi:8-oxo-dGTP pyrophosphatase MutT (NUDIX family)